MTNEEKNDVVLNSAKIIGQHVNIPAMTGKIVKMETKRVDFGNGEFELVIFASVGVNVFNKFYTIIVPYEFINEQK